MHRFTLKFLNPHIETLYQAQNLTHQTKLFSTFLIFQFFFITFLAICTLFQDPQNYDHISIFSASAFFLIVLWRIRFKWPHLYQIGLNIFFFGFGLILTEFALLIKIADNWVLTPEVLAFIIPIQSFSCLMLLVRLNWMLSSLIYLFNVIYFLFRLVSCHNCVNELYVWVGLFVGVINFSYMSFREQSILRELFKKNHESYENLNFFHLLLRNVLPNSIFILNYDKPTPEIEFVNTHSLKLISKILDEENFITSSRCIDKSFKSKIKAKTPRGQEITYEKIKNFLGKFDVLDQKLDAYHNNIPQILHDHFHSKMGEVNRLSSNTDGKTQDIEFLSINLSRTIAFDQIQQKTNRSQCFDRMTGLTQILNSERDHFNIRETQREVTMQHSLKIEMEPKVKYYEMKAAKIRWNDRNGLLVMVSDISKTKKIIDLKNLDKHKNQLLASISHDLRTPLNGVIGMVNATLSELKEDKLKDFLKLALRSANLLDFLIKDILDFSQMSYKQLRLNIEYFDIKMVIQEVFSLMKFQARTRSISLEMESCLPDGLLCKSDPNRIKQILINLLGKFPLFFYSFIIIF